MERRDNYQIQAGQAKQHFLTYDQSRLAAKLHLKMDADYIYVNFLCKLYRLCRCTGNLEYLQDDRWQDGNSYEEVMTLLDLLFDSWDDRMISGNWKNMQSFGLQFHQNLLEERRNPTADLFDRSPESFRSACLALGGRPIRGGDIGYAVELMDGLEIALLFWHGDEEFYPRVRYLWDENALQYLRYETMYFAVSLLLRRIREEMEKVDLSR